MARSHHILLVDAGEGRVLPFVRLNRCVHVACMCGVRAWRACVACMRGVRGVRACCRAWPICVCVCVICVCLRACAQPQAERNQWGTAQDKAFCDPGYGALVRAMQVACHSQNPRAHTHVRLCPSHLVVSRPEGLVVPNAQEGHADSLLVCAARHGRTKTMRLLIEMHANVDQVTPREPT